MEDLDSKNNSIFAAEIDKRHVLLVRAHDADHARAILTFGWKFPGAGLFEVTPAEITTVRVATAYEAALFHNEEDGLFDVENARPYRIKFMMIDPRIEPGPHQVDLIVPDNDRNVVP